MKDSGSIDGGKFYTSLASTCQSPIAIYEPPADLVPLYRRKLLAQVAPRLSEQRHPHLGNQPSGVWNPGQLPMGPPSNTRG